MSTSIAGLPSVDRRQPWLGLSSYRESDAELFFGRSVESVELLRFVRRDVLTVLFGPSGTGKTSLLNAGLFPLLRGAGFFPVAIRLDHSSERPDYIGQIRKFIAGTLQVKGTPPIEMEALAPLKVPVEEETLWEYLHRVVFWDERNNIVTPVLVFDQFEEIFTLGGNRDARSELLASLADVIENYIPASVRLRLEEGGEVLGFPYDQPKSKIVFSLREDFVSRLDILRRSMPAVMHNRFVISRMNGEQALLAVSGPGRGIVDAPVAEEIVRFVAAANQLRAAAGNADVRLDGLQVDPALLSVVCRELNARRIEEDKDHITGDLLRQAGTNILDEFYERSFIGVYPVVRKFVEDRLLTASGFRGTVPLEEATQAGIAEADINTLIDRRIIRTEERLGIPHLELTHDLLIGVVRASRDERMRVEKVREQERAAEEAWERARVEREQLKRERQRELEQQRRELERAQERADAEQLRAEGQARTSRSLRRMIGGLVALLIVLFAVAGWAWHEWDRADQEKQRADYQRQQAELAKTQAVEAQKNAEFVQAQLQSLQADSTHNAAEASRFRQQAEEYRKESVRASREAKVQNDAIQQAGKNLTAATPGGNNSRSAASRGTEFANELIRILESFPVSRSVDTLSEPFRENVRRFLAAIKASGATVAIGDTLRPPERAYIMHYAFAIARSGLNPATVPPMAGVKIDWVQNDANGQPDPSISKLGAEGFVNNAGLLFVPALSSRHTEGKAIDVDITWQGNLTIVDGRGNEVIIASIPRSGAVNIDLHEIGKSYGVYKLMTDAPHWSSDGR